MPRSAPFLVAGLGLALSACAALGPPARVSPAGSPPALTGRTPDSLLARPALQAVVDLQLRRDGEALVRLLGSDDRLVRARAAFALGSVQDSTAVPALIGALGDAAPAVRANAAFAIGQAADSTAGVALLVALRTEATATVQAEIADALGKSGGRADLDALLGMDLPVAVEPARALALARMALRGVETPAGWAWLAARLRVSDASLTEAAAYAFSRVPSARWAAHAGAVRMAFDALADRDEAALTRMHLARALGRLADVQDVPRLTEALRSADDWRVRQAAAAALGAPALGGPGGLATARTALWTALDDDQPLVAQTAAEALARPAPRPAGAPFTLGEVSSRQDETDRARAFVRGRAPWPVQAALLPLVARTNSLTDGTPGEAVIAQWAARQTEPFAQAAALVALGSARDEASRDRLFATATNADPRLAAAAVEALRARFAAEPDRALVAVRYYPAFAAALRRRDLATTAAAAPALADSVFAPLGAPALLREVYGQLSAPGDVEPMVEIVRAIGQTRDGEEVEFLVGAALNGHPAVRAAARDALNERLTEGIDVSLPASGLTVSPTTSIDWTHLRRVGPRPRLVLETSRGRIVIEMDAESAPQTVQLLTSAASAGDYDGVPFHRVVPNFVVQGGDFYRRDGYGGPEVPIRSEFGRARYRTGTVGIASAGKDTEGVQFFITHSPQPHLDGRYTVVGQVVSGQDVADRLLPGDLIRRARVTPDRRR